MFSDFWNVDYLWVSGALLRTGRYAMQLVRRTPSMIVKMASVLIWQLKYLVTIE
jgi:hypothetical protein